WEQALQTSAKKKKVGGLRRYGTVGILTPQNPDKEKLFKGRWSDTQTYTGDPGNYRLTQAVFQEGRGGYLLSYISRIFQSVPIQKGKLLYLGEINVVKPKKQDPVFIYTLSKAGLEEFRQKYPQSSQYLVSRDLGLGMKTVE
ncbi:MAG TPA: hypothetical protein DF383_08305, partial [Deltaproteobacteria bacterium]|nr:hypothetical protein [Deltaproteobacteria bacterium]